MKRNILAILSVLIIGATLCPMTSSAQRKGGGGTTTLDPIAKQALITALTAPEGEYAARAEYAAILAVPAWAGAQPFANILLAEENHVNALKQQCVRYGVPIPADTYFGNVAAPATLLEAAETGVVAETLNVAMYDDLLSKVQKYPSLVQVFTNLRAASLNNHLSAFEAAVANGGSLPCVCRDGI
jgi:hypothetical protein